MLTTRVPAVLVILALSFTTSTAAYPHPPPPIPTTVITNAAADTPEPSDVAIELAPDITIVGPDADENTVDETVNLFRESGLELPDLEIRFFDDDTNCHGHLGMFYSSFTPWRVHICSQLEFVLTHELAHAWEHATLDDHDRARYLTTRSLSAWNDPNTPWNQRGAEDAAFIIQQNLMTDTAPKNSTTWQDRVTVFELLTGRPSPINLE